MFSSYCFRLTSAKALPRITECSRQIYSWASLCWFWDAFFFPLDWWRRKLQCWTPWRWTTLGWALSSHRWIIWKPDCEWSKLNGEAQLCWCGFANSGVYQGCIHLSTCYSLFYIWLNFSRFMQCKIISYLYLLLLSHRRFTLLPVPPFVSFSVPSHSLLSPLSSLLYFFFLLLHSMGCV